MKLTLAGVLIGGSVNFVLIWLLSKYSERLALYYALLLLFVLVLAYWQQIAASFSLSSSLLRALTSANKAQPTKQQVNGGIKGK